jgi:hypothetical protein
VIAFRFLIENRLPDPVLSINATHRSASRYDYCGGLCGDLASGFPAPALGMLLAWLLDDSFKGSSLGLHPNLAIVLDGV